MRRIRKDAQACTEYLRWGRKIRVRLRYSSIPMAFKTNISIWADGLSELLTRIPKLFRDRAYVKQLLIQKRENSEEAHIQSTDTDLFWQSGANHVNQFGLSQHPSFFLSSIFRQQTDQLNGSK